MSMNVDKINKMKYDLIDDLSDSQVELLVKSLIIDKYCMNKDELVDNELGLVDVFQYLINNDKIVHVLNGVYGAYNELLYDLKFKGFTIDYDDINDINDGFMDLATSIEKSREKYQNKEIEQLKKENEELKKKLTYQDEMFDEDEILRYMEESDSDKIKLQALEIKYQKLQEENERLKKDFNLDVDKSTIFDIVDKQLDLDRSGK